MNDKLTLTERIELSEKAAQEASQRQLREANSYVIDLRPERRDDVPTWADIAYFLVLSAVATFGLLMLILWKEGML